MSLHSIIWLIIFVIYVINAMVNAIKGAMKPKPGPNARTGTPPGFGAPPPVTGSRPAPQYPNPPSGPQQGRPGQYAGMPPAQAPQYGYPPPQQPGGYGYPQAPAQPPQPARRAASYGMSPASTPTRQQPPAATMTPQSEQEISTIASAADASASPAKQRSLEDLLKTQSPLVGAIIMQEILSPPKCHRHGN